MNKIFDPSGGFGAFLATNNMVITILLAIVTITIIGILFLNITKLSAAADNDYGRRVASSGILTCLICLGLIGGIDIVYAILMSIIFGLGG